MFKLDNVYRNTCCMCCGIPQESSRFFIKEDGTKVPATVDHILLRSLDGPNTQDNLVLMCFECNQMRGNLFAELSEFIDWYWSDTPLPKEKNFSYLRGKHNSKKSFEKYKLKQHKVLQSTSSVLTGTIELNGYKYEQYKHPLFGTSLVKIESHQQD